MTSAWLLPEHIADVLPAEARRIEEGRRKLLDLARGYGFELVIPPLLEHLESLLSGTGSALDLKTFKLVDQLSGRMVGVRADTTPQVARIDAHLLNRAGVTRLCYCGPVLHALPSGSMSNREQLQFGAEIYGHAGLEADLEVQDLALDGLHAAGVGALMLDMGDARIVRGVLAGVPMDAQALTAIVAALTAKDRSEVESLSARCDAATREALVTLLDLYGGEEVLDEARRRLPQRPVIAAALDDLAWLATHVRRAREGVAIGFDLSDMSGYAYYSGSRFAVYGAGSSDALARGGRYDEVGAVFGRNRPAVGFSLDLKVLADVSVPWPHPTAVRAPWGEDPELRAAVRRLRESGETVLAMLPGHELEAQAFEFDRELVQVRGQWVLRTLDTRQTPAI
jgi:ATP phosphoribosyltransferase regulatory subunit